MAATAVALASIGTAVAISGGGYTPEKQGCKAGQDSHNREHRAQPKGCHDMQILVSDGKGHTYAEAGANTNKEGDNVHSGSVVVSPSGSASPTGRSKGSAVGARFDTKYQPIPHGQCGVFDLLTYPIDVATGGGCTFDPTKWRAPSGAPTVTPKVAVGKKVAVAPDATSLKLYFGADDGLDSGEHDEPDGKHGTSKEQTGPSDGGAIVVNWHPTAATSWLPLVMAGVEKGKPAYAASNPFPFLDAGAGGCADGICVAGESRQRTIWRGGGGGGKKRDAYNYDGKTWDPYNCSGASTKAEKSCKDKTHKNEDNYRHDEAKRVVANPGVQLYEDPDPNGSPIAPSYPIPSLYAGTCGVTAGGGSLKAPASRVTNKSGQVSVSPTGC